MRVAKPEKAVGILGGSFDPVHNAHIRVAKDLYKTLGLDKVYLMPCYKAVHKTQLSSGSDDRVNMLVEALKAEEQLELDEREVRRGGPSFTVDSLEELRSELGEHCAIYFAMGTDAFNHLQTWKNWQRLFELANLVVMHRPEVKLSHTIPDRHFETFSGAHKSSGCLIDLPVTQLPVSSTDIRIKIQAGEDVTDLIPTAVQQYIQEKALYQS